jgi:hypothetical protein
MGGVFHKPSTEDEWLTVWKEAKRLEVEFETFLVKVGKDGLPYSADYRTLHTKLLLISGQLYTISEKESHKKVIRKQWITNWKQRLGLLYSNYRMISSNPLAEMEDLGE